MCCFSYLVTHKAWLRSDSFSLFLDNLIQFYFSDNNIIYIENMSSVY